MMCTMRSAMWIFAGIGRLNEPELVQDRHHPSVTRLLRRYPAALILRAGRVRSHLKCFDTGRDAGVCSCGWGGLSVQSCLGSDSWSSKLVRTPLDWSSSVEVVSEECRGIVSDRSSALLRGGDSGLQRHRDAWATRMTRPQQDTIDQLTIKNQCTFLPPGRCFLNLDAGINLDSCW
jgi:hypothetical protein